MARPFQFSVALKTGEVPLAFTEGITVRHSDCTAPLASRRVSLKLKPFAWKGNGTTGLLPSTSGRVQTPQRNSRSGIRCSDGYSPSDSVGDLSANLQQQAILQRLRSSRVIACLRTSSSNLALDAARAALDGGLTVLEVTMNTPSAAQVIKILVQEYPSAIIGAGTVLSKEEADIAKDAGAKFLMSPVTVEKIVRDHKSGPVLFIPGAMTPTEVISVFNLGAPVVKLYPVSLLGGAAFVRNLSKPLGHIPMIASSGIPLDMVDAYISAGAMAVILSDAIFDKLALERKDLNGIRILASAAVLRANTSDN